MVRITDVEASSSLSSDDKTRQPEPVGLQGLWGGGAPAARQSGVDQPSSDREGTTSTTDSSCWRVGKPSNAAHEEYSWGNANDRYCQLWLEQLWSFTTTMVIIENARKANILQKGKYHSISAEINQVGIVLLAKNHHTDLGLLLLDSGKRVDNSRKPKFHESEFSVKLHVVNYHSGLI
ncbi:hypothetical protein MRX96_019182 [Rhipicephalus microplus]